MDRIETDRVVLRRPTPADASALFRVTGDERVMRYWAPGPDRSTDEARARIEAIDDHWQEYGFGDWATIDGIDGTIVGFAGLHHIADMDDVNIGYVLARDRWGEGLGREVADALLEHGFGHLGLSEIVAVVDPRNRRSIALAERCGFVLRERLTWTGHDRLAYAIDRSRWKALRRVGPGR